MALACVFLSLSLFLVARNDGVKRRRCARELKGETIKDGF